MNRIVEKNLELMTSRGDGGMEALLRFESWGGNAGIWEGMTCAGANFYYDMSSGEIVVFSNYPVELGPGHGEGLFRIAREVLRKEDLLNGNEPKKLIVGTFIHEEESAAAEILHQTVEEYNRRYGFSA